MSGSTPPPPPPPPPGPPGPPPPPSYGAAPYGSGAAAPQDWTVIAIVAMIVGLCFSCIGAIPGIIAIVYANKSKKALAVGDTGGAYQSANTAKILVIVTFALAAVGLVSGILYNFAAA